MKIRSKSRRITFTVITLTLLFALLLGLAPQSPIQSVSAQTGTPELSLLSSGEDGLSLQAKLPEPQFGQTRLNEQDYLTLSAPGYDGGTQVGAPNLPVLRKIVEIPLYTEVGIENVRTEGYTQSATPSRAGLRIVPVQAPQPKCGDATPPAAPSAEIYGNDGYYPAENVRIVDDSIQRGHRLLTLEISPVRYNAFSAEFEFTQVINFSLKLNNCDLEASITETDRLNSESFNQVLSGRVLNFNLGRPLSIPNSNERILIITADMFQSALAPFVTLKESQGFIVSVVNLTTVGGNTTAAIKAYITAQYNSATPPVYVILVGDYSSGNPTGSLTNYVFRTGGSYRTDLEFFTMNGSSDYVADMFYGRFPVNTVDQLSAMIDKLQTYNAISGEEAWVKKAEFLATNDLYTVAEGSHNYVINTHTLPKGYTGIFPTNPQAGGDKIYAITYSATGANAINSMNDNRSFVVYSGHGASTFWDAPRVTQTDVRALTGVAIPYVASHACITGDFNESESFADTWAREPVNGALVFYGSSDSTYWDEDDIFERRIFDRLYQDPDATSGPSVAVMTQYGLTFLGGSSLNNYYHETYHIFGDPSLSIVLKAKSPNFRMSFDPQSIKICNSASATAKLNVASINAYTTPVNLSPSTLSGLTATLNPTGPITPPGNTTVTISGNGTAPAGTQTLTVQGVSGTLQHDASLTINVVTPLIAAPALQLPANNARDLPQRPTFKWIGVENAETYTLEIARDAAFEHKVIDLPGLTGLSTSISQNLETDRTYYWRVLAVNSCGSQTSTQTFSFKTKAGPGDCPEGTYDQVSNMQNFEAGLGQWTTESRSGDSRWALSTVRSYSPSTSALASVPATSSDQRLISPAMIVPNTEYPVSLIFWHRWTFGLGSSCLDGGVLEVSVNAGTSWVQVPASELLTTPYNGSIISGNYNPISGKPAWCGTSSNWERTVVDLAAYKGKTVSFRFRMGSAVSDATEGWYVDDVAMHVCKVGSAPAEYHLYIPVVIK